MKINTIIHDKPKEKKNDLHKKDFNKDPKYHPFMKEREYMRAVNATKVDRLLAKPFVKAYNYHLEGITHLAHEKENDIFASSSFDQSTFIWSIKNNTKFKIKNEHRITGLSFLKNKLLIGQNDSVISYTGEWNEENLEIKNVYKTNYINSLTSCKNEFVVSTNEGIKVYDSEKIFPKFSIGNSICNFAEINPVLENLIVFSESSKLNFVDTRTNEIYSNFQLGIKNNDIKFSLDGKLMTVGNEDSVLYVYDLRYLDNTMCFFKHHFSPINCIDFGKKLVSGSNDQTVRIFDVKERRCLDVYHNRRMHNVNGVKLSKTEEFVISGSDDGSLRVWKTNASRKIGPISDIQSRAMAYNEMLKDKFKYVNEVEKISNQRFLPKPLKRELRIRKEKEEARKRREAKKTERND